MIHLFQVRSLDGICDFWLSIIAFLIMIHLCPVWFRMLSVYITLYFTEAYMEVDL